MAEIERVPGDNPGGNNLIQWALADDILIYPQVVDGVITQDLVFVAGRGWQTIRCIENSQSYDDEGSPTENGALYPVTIKGSVRGESAINRIRFANGANAQRFVVKIRDNAYLTKIAGTPNEVLTFKYKYTTGNNMPAMRGYSFEFSGTLTAPVPMLIP